MKLTVTKLSKKQALDLVKVAAYLAVSAVLTYVITLSTDNPEFFGPLTPMVNLALVAARDFLKADQ